MATWRNAITKKFEAGQSEAELANDLEIGAALFDRAAAGAAAIHRNHLRSIAAGLRGDGDLRARIAAALSDETRA
ncbi:maltotransferase domain-containing protein, partial [Enterococcus faecalis]|uniref:maltotransferase domain-containing protein n=2 Tax=Bacillati TaxID=1783272 RepID=UPI00254A66B5